MWNFNKRGERERQRGRDTHTQRQYTHGETEGQTGGWTHTEKDRDR